MSKCERCFANLAGTAKKIKRIIQMFIGLSIILVLLAKFYFYMRYAGGLDNPTDTLYLILNLTRNNPLQIVGYGLAFSAGVELSYMLFSEGPDEAVEPLILGLASAVLIVIAEDDLIKWEVALTVLVFTACVGFLFYIRQKYDVSHDLDEICRIRPNVDTTSYQGCPQKLLLNKPIFSAKKVIGLKEKRNKVKKGFLDVSESKKRKYKKSKIQKVKRKEKITKPPEKLGEATTSENKNKGRSTQSFLITLKEIVTTTSDVLVIFSIANISDKESVFSIEKTSRIVTHDNTVCFSNLIRLNAIKYNARIKNELISKEFYSGEVTLLTLAFSNYDVKDSNIFLTELVGKDSGTDFSLQFLKNG